MFHSQNHAVVHKESATGQEIVAENTANAPLELRIYGASEQGESTEPVSPSPDYPSEIVSAVDFKVGSNTTATINQPLRGIPDGSGGWAARDYIEVKDGAVRLVRECGEYVLNRDLIWMGWGPMESGLYSYYISRPDYKKATGKEDYIKSESWGYCDQFKWLGAFRVNGKDYRARKEECISGFQGPSAMFMITTSQFTTMDAWKAHLDEGSLKLLAELETPQITDITATDLGGALLSMKSVQYYTRIYHNSTLPVELEAAVTMLGR